MMNKGYQSNLKAHRLNFIAGLSVFWGIVFLVMALSIVVNITTDMSVGLFVVQHNDDITREVSVVAASFVAIVIYMIVVGLALLPETYSFYIGMGSSRKNYYKGLVTVLVLVSLINALIHSTAFGVESLILAQTRLQQLDYLNVCGFQLSLVSLTVIQWLIFTATGAVFTFVAALLYRFRGRNTLVAMAVVGAILLVFPTFFGVSLLGRLVRWVISNASPLQLSGKLLLVSLTSWGLGWLVVRRMEAR